MGYIENSLGQNETLVSRARFHWIYQVLAWLALIFFAALGFLFFERSTSAFFGLATAAVGVVVFFAILIPVWTTEIGVTNQRLVIKRGFFTKYTDELELKAVEQVELAQSFWERLFGIGRLNIQGTGGAETMKIPSISEPIEFRRAIQSASTEAGRGA